MHLSELQARVRARYHRADEARGLAGTHMWFCEEVGELTRALRRGETANLPGEFADVLAYLATLANLVGVDLEQAFIDKFESGTPEDG